MLVSLNVTDDVASVRLTDPQHRNALSPEMNLELESCVKRAESEGAGAIVLTADPPVFSAGGSLDSLLNRGAPLSDVYRGFVALAESPLPTIAAIGSPAIGAGVNLALCCDVVLVSERATFDPRFLDVAIHPGGGHMFRLAQRIGSQGAAAMVIFGDAVSGKEAVEVGLAWRCLPEDELESRAIEMARVAARRSRALVLRTKQTLVHSLQLSDPREALELEREAQEWSMDQPEFEQKVREIVASISAKRATVEPEK